MDPEQDEIVTEWIAKSAGASALDDSLFALTPLQRELGVTKPVVFLATMAFDFGKFHAPPTADQEKRFENLQRSYRRHATEGRRRDDDDEPVLRLSPRMVAENESDRLRMKKVCFDILRERARAAEEALEGRLREEEEARKVVEARVAQLRNKRKKKKKNKQKKRRSDRNEESVDEKSEIQEGASDGSPPGTTDANSMRSEVAGSEVDGPADEIGPPIGIATERDRSERETGEEKPSASPIQARPLSVLAEGRTDARADPLPKSIDPLPPPRRTYLEAAKIAQLSSEVERLNDRLRMQRREHLEMIQQVQLKAYIAETKAAAETERSECLERLLVDSICDAVAGEVADAVFEEAVASVAAAEDEGVVFAIC